MIRKRVLLKKISETCIPLTIEQRTADYILMEYFRLTGTMSSLTGRNQSIISDTYLQDTLGQYIDSWFGLHRSDENMQMGMTMNIQIPKDSKYIYILSPLIIVA